jgi:hypothetical protein
MGRAKIGILWQRTSVFTPVLAKHSKSFSLIDCISVGVDRMQRNFEPMTHRRHGQGGYLRGVRKQVEPWQRSESSSTLV